MKAVSKKENSVTTEKCPALRQDGQADGRIKRFLFSTSAKVKKTWIYTSDPSCVFMA
jgi:hypothetical protein